MTSKRIKQFAFILALSFAALSPAQEEAAAELSPLEVELNELIDEIKQGGETMERIVRLGDLHAQLGHPKRAVASYQKVISEFGGSELVYNKLARVLLIVGRPELGLEILKIGVKEFPKSAGLSYELGRVYGASGKVYAAIASLERAVALQPKNQTFRYELAIAYRVQKKWDESLELVESLIKEGTKEIPVYLMKGDLLLVKGREREAVRVLEDLYEEHPESPDTRRVLVHAYQMYAYKEAGGGRLGRSINTMEDALEIDPDNPESRTALGSFYKEMGDLEKAEQAFKTVVEASPNYFEVYLLYGEFLWGQDRPDEMRAMYDAGLEQATAANNEAFAEHFKKLLSGGAQ